MTTKGTTDVEQARTTYLTRAVGHITRALGSMPAIFLAALLVFLWLIGGFFVKQHFGNNSYQLLINTATTIITFLMVFVIQNVQNRESAATQVKLDAMISALVALSEKAGISTDDEGPLAELVGMEEAREKDILREQKRVRADPKTGSGPTRKARAAR